jgi:hypothetical protein
MLAACRLAPRLQQPQHLDPGLVYSRLAVAPCSLLCRAAVLHVHSNGGGTDRSLGSTACPQVRAMASTCPEGRSDSFESLHNASCTTNKSRSGAIEAT